MATLWPGLAEIPKYRKAAIALSITMRTAAGQSIVICMYVEFVRNFLAQSKVFWRINAN